MIDQSLLDAVKQYAQSLSKDVTFVMQTGTHSKRDELKTFLEEISSVSEKIHVIERDFSGARNAISFTLEVDNQATGIYFSGIPGGHEFSSLILALLQAGGAALKLDNSIQNFIRTIDEPLHFETFVSLSCHNCPEVVQALNQFALLNPLIHSEMIDGGLFQEEIEKRNIQGVPAVFLNGQSFINGKIDTAKIIEKLLEKYPHFAQKMAAEEQLPLQDVTVIGGGPAGSAAAIYAARKGLKVTLIADRIGGQVKDTVSIENLIGTKETTGSKLALQLQEHIQANAITVKENISVKSVEAHEGAHVVILQTGERIQTKTLIVASGAKWRELGVPGEKENLGKGVAYCPHCDGPFFKGKHVAVIGGGNSGIEAAIDLSGIVRKVSVFEFADTLKADKVLVDSAQSRDNIEIFTGVMTQSIAAENGKVTAIRYQERASGAEKTLALDGVFVQIGLIPNTAFLGDAVKRTRFGEIEINGRCETSTAGIFAAGDCTNVPYKQIIIAMGEGAKAALSAFDYLIRQK